MDIPVHHAEQDYWQTSKDDVIELDVPLIKDRHRAEATVVCIEILRDSTHDVLIEEVKSELGDASVARSTVDKD